MTKVTAKEVARLCDVASKAQMRVLELEEFITYVSGLESYADDLQKAGMVDYPHVKALRAASRKARELLAPSLPASAEPVAA